MVGVLPIRIVKFNVSTLALRQKGGTARKLLSDEVPTLETLELNTISAYMYLEIQ